MLQAVSNAPRVMAIWREPFKLGSPNIEHWPEGLTIEQIVERMPCLPNNFREVGHVTVNGSVVPFSMWPRVRPKARTAENPVAVTFQVRTQGGRGGGGGGKAVLKIVAALALTLATAGVAAYGVPLLGIAGGTFGASLVAAGVSLVGSLILNGLSSTPARSSSASKDNTDGGSDVDASSVNGNVLQPNAAVPRVIGSRRIFPPFAFEPVTELIGQDEYVDAVYCLAGPHSLTDVRLGNTSVSTTELDADVAITMRDGRSGSPELDYTQRYGRTFPINVEMSVHGTNPDDLSIYQPPLPVYHSMSTADSPDEAWLHMLSMGMVKQSGGNLVPIRIPLRVRLRRRGDANWRYLPEIHYMDKTQSQRRLQIKFLFGNALAAGLPAPSTNRGFIECRKFVPAQNVTPVGTDFNADAYFSAGAGNDVYNALTTLTTNVRNITLSADTIEVYLSNASWPPGIYDIEIKRGATFLNSSFTSSTYVYSGQILDFFGNVSTNEMPMTRDELLDRMQLVRMVSIKKQRPVDQKNMAMIYLRVRNRSVNNLSVQAAGYVNDYVSAADRAWTYRASAQDNDWRSVAWSPELSLFVAVANTGTNRVMTSPDGINWTPRIAAEANQWYSVCWSPQLGIFVAVANTGTNRVMTSPDGINWTARAAASAVQWANVCWSPELLLFVAAAFDGGTNQVMTSPNGITWTIRTTPGAMTWRGLCWSPQLMLFVAVADNGVTNSIMTSSDGINWIARNSPNTVQWFSVAWSSKLGLFAAVGSSGTGNKIITSPDGINWTARVEPSILSWWKICWAETADSSGLFIAVANASAVNGVMTSPDGINWTQEIAPTGNWVGVDWSPELNLAAATGNSGVGNRVITRNTISVGWHNEITTSNPAPHYRDILSGLMNFDPLPEELHDDAALVAWRQACITNGDTCDLIVEGAALFDILRIVSSCGYARPYQSEIWGVIRDYDRSSETPTQIFSNRNMKDFKWRKAFPRLPAGFRVNFKDENYEYTGKQITVYREGADETDVRTEQVTYDGLISRSKVIQRAKIDLKQGEFRSAIYTFSAAADAIVCRRGSLIAVNHDTFLTMYGSGRINTVLTNTAGQVIGIELDNIIDVKNIADLITVANLNVVQNMNDLGYRTSIAIRKTTGEITLHPISNATGETYTLMFSTPVADAAGPGSYRAISSGCLITIGVTSKEYKRMIVTDIVPDKEMLSTITAVDEAPQIWQDTTPTDFLALIPFEGADAATTAPDLSQYARALTFGGDAQLDTAFFKTGVASAYFPGGVTGYIRLPSSSDFAFKANEPFTIHMWVRPHAAALTAFAGILGRYPGVGVRSFILYYHSTTGIVFVVSADGTNNTAQIVTNQLLIADQWAHIAITRDANGIMRVFVNGIQSGSGFTTFAGAFFDPPATPIGIGSWNGGAAASAWRGHIDQVEIIRGKALWVSAFQPPNQ